MEDLLNERKAAMVVVDNIDKQINDKKRRTIVQCTDSNYGKGCGMASTIADLVYIQTHWYERPHGCMGGDNWHQGDGEFDCPHCGRRNRLYNRPDIQALKHFFGDCIDEHEKD